MNDLLRARLAAQGGLMTTAVIYSCGYTSAGLSRLVARGDLLRVRKGSFMDGRLMTDAGPELRHVLTARAVSAGYLSPHAISHTSALAVHALPLLNITPDNVHLTLTGTGYPRTRPGLRVHPELPDLVARRRNGCRVVHPSVAVVQSAALAGIAVGVAAADAALAAGQVTTEDLKIALRLARLGPGRSDAGAVVGLPGGPADLARSA